MFKRSLLLAALVATCLVPVQAGAESEGPQAPYSVAQARQTPGQPCARQGLRLCLMNSVMQCNCPPNEMVRGCRWWRTPLRC